MKIVLYTNSISAHQLPLAREIVQHIGTDNFRYIYTGDQLQHSSQEVSSPEPWVLKQVKVKGEGEEASSTKESTLQLSTTTKTSTVHLHLEPSPKPENSTVHLQPTPTSEWLETSDILLAGIRDAELYTRRASRGLLTFYSSERWFKPINLGVGHRCRCSVPGWVRLFHPRYFRLAKQFAKLLESPYFRYLPMGPHAARDMRLLCRIMSLLHLHLPPTPTFLPWGYFVSPSDVSGDHGSQGNSDSVSSVCSVVPEKEVINHGPHGSHGKGIRVLWLGRLLDWKRVDTLIRAIAHANSVYSVCSVVPSFALTIVGDGPEKPHLQKLAKHLSSTSTSNFNFLPSVPILEVRSLMRSHDLYILSSNAQEGWGAALNEALSEGMTVLGTYEAGASAALLPASNLFHAGDWRTLAKMLIDHSYVHTELPYDYTPKGAAERLLRSVSSVYSVVPNSGDINHGAHGSHGNQADSSVYSVSSVVPEKEIR